MIRVSFWQRPLSVVSRSLFPLRFQTTCSRSTGGVKESLTARSLQKALSLSLSRDRASLVTKTTMVSQNSKRREFRQIECYSWARGRACDDARRDLCDRCAKTGRHRQRRLRPKLTAASRAAEASCERERVCIRVVSRATFSSFKISKIES